MLFLSTIYHCFWKSNCTRHFPMGGECRVQWKRGAVEAGCSSSRAHAGEGVCVHGGMSCCGTWGLGKRLLNKSRRKKRSWESQERTGACRAEESSLSWRTSVINWSDNKMGFPKCQKRAQGRPFTKKKGGLWRDGVYWWQTAYEGHWAEEMSALVPQEKKLPTNRYLVSCIHLRKMDAFVFCGIVVFSALNSVWFWRVIYRGITGPFLIHHK